MQIRAASDHSLLVWLGEEISLETHQRVLRLFRALQRAGGFRNLHPGYASILISFDPLASSHAEWERRVLELWEAPERAALPESRLHQIRVRYGGEDGPDLEEVAGQHRLTPEEVVRIHASAEYRVYFLGFSPGFPYLGGMPETIATPRLPAPRRTVPAGSVAIGGNQTGIYPVASPGGWHIIGRTSVRLFGPDQQPPTLLEMGDRVRFVPV